MGSWPKTYLLWSFLRWRGSIPFCVEGNSGARALLHRWARRHPTLQQEYLPKHWVPHQAAGQAQQVMRHPSWCSPGYTMGSTMAPPLGRTIAPAMLSPPLTGFQTKWSQNSKYVNAPSVRIEYYTLFNSPSQPFDNTSLLSQWKRLWNYDSIYKCYLLYKDFTIVSLSFSHFLQDLHPQQFL